MWEALKLVLPAIIPSWNFFDVIAPSPRVEYALLDNENKIISEWCEFRPRPEHLSFIQMLKRLLWNPRWNETLFVVSCSERLMVSPTEHSELEILNRISKDLQEQKTKELSEEVVRLQFRLQVIRRNGSQLEREICYQSRIIPLRMLAGDA